MSYAVTDMTPLLLLVVATGGYAADKWDEAERQIVRSEPRSFRQLPAAVVSRLEKDRCRIPQAGPDTNVIEGEFAKKGQKDWAILCSKEGKSAIHLIWGGPARCPDPIELRSDRVYLQEMGGDSIRFSRQITRVAAGEGGGDHDQIADNFLEKASTLLLCRNGKWESPGGSD